MRVLVSAASTHGATAEIGGRIAEVFRHHGMEVDVSAPENVAGLGCYDGLVFGSAIYRGRWKREATDLLRDRSEEIISLPCWLFSSGPIGKNAPTLPLRIGEEARLIAWSEAVEHRMFGGRLELGQLTKTERWLARWVKLRSADRRPWSEIDQWATDVAAQLIAGRHGIPPILGLTADANE